MLLIMSAAEAAYLSASSPSLCRVSRPIRNVNIALNSGVNTGQSSPSSAAPIPGSGSGVTSCVTESLLRGCA